jgi:hypothetical protein
MTTDLEVLTADLAAMQKNQTDINAASVAVGKSNLTPAEMTIVHNALAKASGDLNATITETKAQIAELTPPVVTPPVTPPTNSFPYKGVFGLNNHDLMWNDTHDYPIAQLTAVGAKVFRNDLIADAGSHGQTGVFGSTECCVTVDDWSTKLRAAGIQPLIVITFVSLLDTPTMVAGVEAIVKGTPGLWIEWGNELDYQAPSITAAEYVAQFEAIVTAAHAADPTCKIGPQPIANINPGGDGMVNMQAMADAGLFNIDFDFLPFHCYPWPSATGPTVPWDGAFTVESLIPQATASITAMGYKTGIFWITEFGYQSVDTSATPNMTPALQSQYILEEFTSPQFDAIPVLISYELQDGGGQVYGWMDANLVAKPVYTAVAALV